MRRTSGEHLERQSKYMGHTLLFGGTDTLAGAYKPAAQIHPRFVPLGFTDEDELQSDPFDEVV
jgi:hypothetical protein